MNKRLKATLLTTRDLVLGTIVTFLAMLAFLGIELICKNYGLTSVFMITLSVIYILLTSFAIYGIYHKHLGE
jgi:hypothetical protein